MLKSASKSWFFGLAGAGAQKYTQPLPNTVPLSQEPSLSSTIFTAVSGVSLRDIRHAPSPKNPPEFAHPPSFRGGLDPNFWRGLAQIPSFARKGLTKGCLEGFGQSDFVLPQLCHNFLELAGHNCLATSRTCVFGFGSCPNFSGTKIGSRCMFEAAIL